MFFLSKCCLSQMHSLCCVSKDVDSRFLSAGFLCLTTGAWLDDEGLYICEAKNQFGTIETEARVSVTGLGRLVWALLSLCTTKYFRNKASNSKAVALKYFHILLLLFSIYVFTLPFPAEPPLLAQGTPVITTGLGQSLSIPCMLLDGIPLPERHWSRNGKAVRLFNFQIHAVRHTDNLYVPAWQQFFFLCTGSVEWEDVPEEWWQFVHWKSCARGCWDICLHCG